MNARQIIESAVGFTIGPVYRAVGAGRGRMTDALEGGIYFFPDRERAELWAGTSGHIVTAYLKPGRVKDVHFSVIVTRDGCRFVNHTIIPDPNNVHSLGVVTSN